MVLDIYIMYWIVYHLSLLGSRCRGWNRHLRPLLHAPTSKKLHRLIDASWRINASCHGSSTSRRIDESAIPEELPGRDGSCIPEELPGRDGSCSSSTYPSTQRRCRSAHVAWTDAGGAGPNSIGVHTSPSSSTRHTSPYSPSQLCVLHSAVVCFSFFFFLCLFFFDFGLCLSGIHSGAQSGTMWPARSYNPCSRITRARAAHLANSFAASLPRAVNISTSDNVFGALVMASALASVVSVLVSVALATMYSM